MIVNHGERPAVLRNDEIESIRRAATGPSGAEPHSFVKCGQRVTVVRGPLAGITGILVRKPTSLRLVLSVEMLAQSVAVEVRMSDVAAIGESCEEGAFDSATIAVPHFEDVNVVPPCLEAE